MWQAGMLGRYRNSHRGSRLLSPLPPHWSYLKWNSASPSSTHSQQGSFKTEGGLNIRFAPKSTPNRSWSIASKSRPAFSIASDAEATPNWISRHMTLMLLRCFLRYSLLAVASVKSLISAATLWGAPEYATDSSFEIPL